MIATARRSRSGRDVSAKTSIQEPLRTKARIARAYGSCRELAMSWTVSFQVSSVLPLTKPARASDSSLSAAEGDFDRRARRASLGWLWMMANAAAFVV